MIIVFISLLVIFSNYRKSHSDKGSDKGSDSDKRKRKKEQQRQKEQQRPMKNISLELIKQKIENGEDLNQKDEVTGNTLLHIASRSGKIKIVQLLIYNGANVNEPNNSGMSALHYACNREHFKTARELVSSGANVNQRNSDGDTPLHYAVGFDFLNLLISNGADVNAKNNLDHTPLHLHSICDNTEEIRILLQNGAKINEKDLYGQTAIRLCNKEETVKLLLDAGADYTIIDNSGCDGLFGLDQLTRSELIKEMELFNIKDPGI